MRWANLASFGTLLSALSTLIIAWFTYSAARIARVSANAAKQAADCAERSIEVARESYTASERPWISVDAKVSSDLVKSDYGIDFGVHFRLKNHGLSPARNVHVLYKVVTLKAYPDPFSGARESVYELGKSGSLGPNMGIQIFPSESNVISWRSPLTNDEIRSAYASKASLNNLLPSFYIIGSVFYQSVFSEKLHNTDFIYYVMAIGDNKFPNGSDVPDFDKIFPMGRIHLKPVSYYKGNIS